jgi:hypothetical protein
MGERARESFVNKLQQTASDRAVPIDRMRRRDLPDQDGFELTVKSGGKERIFTISDAQSAKNPEAEIELLINQIGDNE